VGVAEKVLKVRGQRSRSWSDHITDVLISLHWLLVRERIEFKLATL